MRFRLKQLKPYFISQMYSSCTVLHKLYLNLTWYAWNDEIRVQWYSSEYKMKPKNVLCIYFVFTGTQTVCVVFNIVLVCVEDQIIYILLSSCIMGFIFKVIYIYCFCPCYIYMWNQNVFVVYVALYMLCTPSSFMLIVLMCVCAC